MTSDNRLPSSSTAPITVPECLEKKQRGEKLVCLTAYDYAFARLADDSGVDLLLVGDSLGMVMGGRENTLTVTMREMVTALRWVRRGVHRALLVADMPYGSYHLGRRQTVANALRLIRAGAAAVKLEGGARRAPLLRALVEAEIPVVGHIGLTPQSLLPQGGYHVQGREHAAALQLQADARALAGAGAFALVLEGMPRELAGRITRQLAIPTIGIGAGPECDGQILVLHDLLNLSFAPQPKFVRRFADAAALVRGAMENYAAEVRRGGFPSDAESYHAPVPARAANS